MRVLVTGAAGFIGFHVSRRLIETGHSVMGFDSITDYYDVRLKRDRLAALRALQGDYTNIEAALEDRAALDHLLQGFHPDIVIHLAAQAGVRHSLDQPIEYINSNVLGTLNLLESVRHSGGCDHFLFASTSSVYGLNKTMPFKETHATDTPVSLYAASKKSGEGMAHAYSHLFKIPVTCLRFFTVYGPWGRPDMAPFKFLNAIENHRPIDIFGYGRMSRDFTFIDDLVDGITDLMVEPPFTEDTPDAQSRETSQPPYRVVNIGAGKPTALMDFIEAFEIATDKTAEKRYLPMQPGDVEATYADADLLRQLTGRRPSTGVKEGVAAYVSWFREYYGTRAVLDNAGP